MLNVHAERKERRFSNSTNTIAQVIHSVPSVYEPDG